MKIDVSKWGNFKIKDLFPILVPGKAKQDMLSDGDDCFYIGAKKDDNGVMFHCKYDENLVQKGNCIIFITDGEGSVGYANYMDRDFIGTPNVTAGYNKHLNQYNGLFLATIISKERPKYSFGRKWKTKLKGTIIKLPKTSNNKPDWNYMESFIKSFGLNPLVTNIKTEFTDENLDTNDWKTFYLHKLFIPEMGNGIDGTNITMINPSIKYVTRKEGNNGINAIVDEIDEIKPYEPGNITLALGGSIGSCFLQMERFYTGQNVAVLKEKFQLSTNAKLFIISLIKKECKTKYIAFGRELNAHFKKDFTLRLPVLKENGIPVIDKKKEFSNEGYIPDWCWIEDFMKGLPYGDKL